jgi:hypothetical protein
MMAPQFTWVPVLLDSLAGSATWYKQEQTVAAAASHDGATIHLGASTLGQPGNVKRNNKVPVQVVIDFFYYRNLRPL